MRRYCPEAILHLSTNKVYGDTPNTLPIEELDNRYEIHPDHKFYVGINESMNIDHSKHFCLDVQKLLQMSMCRVFKILCMKMY